MPNHHTEPPADPKYITLPRARFVEMLSQCLEEQPLSSLKDHVRQLKETLPKDQAPTDVALTSTNAEEGISFRQDVLLEELDQILAARTLRRARYYLQRLKKATEQVKTTAINDINLRRWKEYDQVLTDSLWHFKRRDNSGAHLGWYWGNFVPQIPHQLMMRYTKQGEWVLDPFAGSGTTLIECRRLGRNGLGVELNTDVVHLARQRIESQPNPFQIVSELVTGDSTTTDFAEMLSSRGTETVQLILMHPPYHDIIRFSEDAQDLSNAPSVDAFLEMLGQVVERTYPLLEEGRYLAVVIGDKYARGEWIPLGFYVMQQVLSRGYTLKSIVVKNFEKTRAKREQAELWRYRALVGGFYVFKHEYVFIFKKTTG